MELSIRNSYPSPLYHYRFVSSAQCSDENPLRVRLCTDSFATIRRAYNSTGKIPLFRRTGGPTENDEASADIF